MAQFTSFQTFLNAGLHFGDYILIILHIKSPPAKLRPPGFIKCQNKTITHILFIRYHEEKFTLCLTKYHTTSRLFFFSLVQCFFSPQPSATLMIGLVFWGSVRPELLSSEHQDSATIKPNVYPWNVKQNSAQGSSAEMEEYKGTDKREIEKGRKSCRGIFLVSSSG